MTKQEITFRMWLRRKFSRERIGKWWKSCREVLSYPIWEIIYGLLMVCFSPLCLLLGLPLGVIALAFHLTVNVLIVVHGVFRQEQWVWKA